MSRAVMPNGQVGSMLRNSASSRGVPGRDLTGAPDRHHTEAATNREAGAEVDRSDVGLPHANGGIDQPGRFW